MDFAAAIDKNRHALLRIVGWWLMIAQLALYQKDRLLPKRFARSVSNHLSKVEAASRLLLYANAMRLMHDLGLPDGQKRDKRGLLYPTLDTKQITLRDVVCRLKAIKNLLDDFPQQAELLRQKLAKRHAASEKMHAIRNSHAFTNVDLAIACPSLLLEKLEPAAPP